MAWVEKYFIHWPGRHNLGPRRQFQQIFRPGCISPEHSDRGESFIYFLKKIYISKIYNFCFSSILFCNNYRHCYRICFIFRFGSSQFSFLSQSHSFTLIFKVLKKLELNICKWVFLLFVSSHWMCSVKKGVLKYVENFTQKRLCWSLKHSRIPNLKNICERLLLIL